MSGNLPNTSSTNVDIHAESENFTETDDRESEDVDSLDTTANTQQTVVPHNDQQTSKKSTRRPTTNNEVNAKLLKLEEKKIELLTAQVQSSSKNEMKSDDYHYFMSLLPVMEKFNFLQKMRIRNKLQEAIMFELSSLEEYQPVKVTPVCNTPLLSNESGASSVSGGSRYANQGDQEILQYNNYNHPSFSSISNDSQYEGNNINQPFYPNLSNK